ncbi:hypothetical protein MF271_21990 (plasmid) [Deinococcus sp. KNUC1210]|uniref:hypothetical protein n=1 Tax=Deinococcus sp. KNUC1210 TaxID=2917691 RepID=UPI001EF040A2|nr:hypothetical protein [Deinococcus sp. KNUC1210]ULH18151.1 hypothetical protein MF271_21990 [Deinococcus sp. KNUC1210]
MDEMAATFIFAVTAPEGAVHSCFEVEDDQQYGPEDVTIVVGPPSVSGAETLTLMMKRLPDDETYRMLAAQAATNHAEVIVDPLRRLIRSLIPL